MDRKLVIEEVTGIFRDVLDNDDILLKDETTAKDIEKWDSLTHIHLIVAIERKYKIRFTSKEIQSWENVGEMIDGICSKMG